jgi:hypothetical protein
LGLILDAMYFNGYYRDQVVVVIERSINFLSDLARR